MGREAGLMGGGDAGAGCDPTAPATCKSLSTPRQQRETPGPSPGHLFPPGRACETAACRLCSPRRPGLGARGWRRFCPRSPRGVSHPSCQPLRPAAALCHGVGAHTGGAGWAGTSHSLAAGTLSSRGAARGWGGPGPAAGLGGYTQGAVEVLSCFLWILICSRPQPAESWGGGHKAGGGPSPPGSGACRLRLPHLP